MVTLDLDFSQNLGTLPRWQRYTNELRYTRDLKDELLLKDINMTLERIYYVLTDICPSTYEFNSKNYIWYGASHYDRRFGDDGIIDNVLSHGAQPLINLGGIPAFLGNETVGIFSGQENNWKTLIYDILIHLKSKYPEIIYISLFNEVMDGWKWYNECYKLTSYAVDLVNASLPVGVTKLKFGGKEDYSIYDGYFPSYNGGVSRHGEGVLPSFLDYVKNNNLNLDFLTWHIYDHTRDGYFGLPQGDVNSVAISTQKMKEWLDIRGMTAELFITEWTNRGDNIEINLYPVEQCKEATWTVAGWSVLMATGINAIPINFANMDYGQPNQSIFAPDKAYYNVNGTLTLRYTPYPDGTYLAKYNIYKMLKMSKNYLVAAKNRNNAYIIASKDDSGIAVIIANNQNISQSVTVNFSNLPASFRTGNIHYEQYLVDMTHSVFDWLYTSNPNYLSSPLEKVDDISISPTSSFNKVYNMDQYSTILIVMTPKSQPCQIPQFDFQTTQP